MDSNLGIYEPLKLAGSPVCVCMDECECSVYIPTPKTRSTENVVEAEVYPNDELSEDRSSGTVEKKETLEELWNFGEMPGEFGYHFGEEEEEEEELEEEEVESLIEWPDCVSLPASVSEADKAGWATYRLAYDPWADEKKPSVSVLNYNDFELTDEEADGVLSDRVVGACASFLDRNPESQAYCHAKLQLKGKGLTDITILEAHRYLQYIDLSWNHLTDLYPLGGIPYLMYLDVSHNDLTSVLQFKASWNLTFVDYSYNEVETIDDLTDFWSIEYLNLSHNEIKKIEGLENLRYLTDLDLSFNQIERLENLSNLRVQHLNLSNNNISSFEEGEDVGLKTMQYLHFINLSVNGLTSLALFKGVYHIRIVIMQRNKIAELMETDHLKTLHLLQELDLTGNPLTQWDKYREIIFHTIPSLCFLDDSVVRTREKVAAESLFAPSEILAAARDHSRLILVEELNQPSLELDTLPIDQGPYPLVVLVGPPGSGKETIIASLVSRFPTKIHAGVCHTTRSQDPEETDGVDYHFVSQEEFNKLTRNGMFLCVNEFLGASYGLNRMEVAQAVKDKQLCITHMDLVGALTLNNRGIQPHLVLFIIEDEDLHVDRLRQRYEAVIYDDKSFFSGAVSVRKRSALKSIAALRHTRSATVIAGNILESLLWEKVYPSLPETLSPVRMETVKEEVGEQSETVTETKEIRPHKNVRLVSIPRSDSCLAPKQFVRRDTSWGIGLSQEDETENTSSDDVSSSVEEMNGIETDLNNKDTSVCEPTTKDNVPNKQAFSCSEIVDTVWYGLDKAPSLIQLLPVNKKSQQFEENVDPECPIALSTPVNEGLKLTFECPSVYSTLTEMSNESELPECQQNEENRGEHSEEENPGEMSQYQQNEKRGEHSEEEKPCEMSETERLWQQQTANWTESEDSIQNVEELYIRSILNTRDAYFKVHRENPGIFSETVYSDDFDQAFSKLYKHIKDTFISRPSQRPTFTYEADPAYKLMIPRRLELFSQDIYRGHSTMEKQMDAAPKSDILQPIKQRSVYKIVGDIENVGPKLHSRKCNLNY